MPDPELQQRRIQEAMRRNNEPVTDIFGHGREAQQAPAAPAAPREALDNATRTSSPSRAAPADRARTPAANPETEHGVLADIGSTAFDAALGIADYAAQNGAVAGRAAHVIPGAAELYSAVQVPYHLGGAVYDAATGDRDGAVGHVAQSVVSGVGVLPGVSETIGGLDIALSSNSAMVQGAMAAMGIEGGDQVPGSVGDIAEFAAVAGTNALFGADDSNWSPLTDGDTPEGTRQGEITAGFAGIGMVATPIGAAELGAIGYGLTEAGQALGVGPSDEPGSTNGAEPGVAARTGQWIHHQTVDRAWNAARDWWND